MVVLIVSTSEAKFTRDLGSAESVVESVLGPNVDASASLASLFCFLLLFLLLLLRPGARSGDLAGDFDFSACSVSKSLTRGAKLTRSTSPSVSASSPLVG